jgi:hypothetical protein
MKGRQCNSQKKKDKDTSTNLKVWRHQKSNQKPYIGGQLMQSLKEKSKDMQIHK